MAVAELERLVDSGMLKRLPRNESELMRLIQSGNVRLQDALNADLAGESRFDLSYNAAHSFALAALRHHGYRSENKFIVFQVLEHTAQVRPSTWRVLARAHTERNLIEYQGGADIDETLLRDLIAATERVQESVRRLLL